MRVTGTLTGSKIILDRQAFVGETMGTAGVPVVQPGAGEAGLMLATTTACDNLVGITNAASGTYATAQSGTTDVQATVEVIINPDAIITAKLSGGATEDTALTLRAVTTANNDGLTITGGDWNTTDTDEGAIWGYDGTNPGVVRKITSTSTTVATVDVAFPADSVVGDNYTWAPCWPYENHTVTLSTLLTQIRQDVAVATNTAAFVTIELLARSEAESGRTNSYVRMISGNHILGGVLN